jgi:hypothetical protein
MVHLQAGAAAPWEGLYLDFTDASRRPGRTGNSGSASDYGPRFQPTRRDDSTLWKGPDLRKADLGGPLQARPPRMAYRRSVECLAAYYVITDGQILSVWDFQGAIAPDREVLRVDPGELDEKFNDLYSRLNPQAAAVARKAKVSRLTEAQ